MPRISRRFALRAAAAVSAAVLAVSLTPAVSHAVPPKPTPGLGGTVISAAEALARGTGIALEQAQRQLVRETRSAVLAQQLNEVLGDDRAAGSWLDGEGRLHVAVVDASAARAAEASGAVVKRVKFSQRTLDSVTDRLDAAVKAGDAAGVQSWGIDPRTNQVVVRTDSDILRGKVAAILDQGRRAGTVRVERVETKAVLTATVYGGREYESNGEWVCSIGFNATDRSGRRLVITAGHCTGGVNNFSYAGASLGTLRGSSFPGNDYGAINLASGMTPSPLVDMWDGYGVRVQGSRVAQVGATVCKSGRTTGWTCGQVVSFNNSVNYGNGYVVYGLTRHNACLEPGDSGGATMSGGQAQGLSSGGALYQSDRGDVCGGKVGLQSISFFQPVNEALSRYGARLLTS